MYFITVESVKNYARQIADSIIESARTGYRGLSCYWRAWIWDGGTKVMKATRAGSNGTGERWIFEQCS